MKRFIHLTFLSVLLSVIFVACSSDDDNIDDTVETPVTQINSVTYELGSVSNSSISGKAKIIENSDATITVELSLENTSEGSEHPAHIHFNTAAEGGDIAITLGSVNGDTGESSVTFNSLDNGTPITYEELIDFDGYINVHFSSSELSTLIAQGDIGQNELTGNFKAYELNEKDIAGISGTIEFAERVNKTTLVTISLEGTIEGNTHPAHIHENDVATTGDIIAGLNAVDGATGISKTQIENLVGGATITYEEFLSSNAYVNVHLSDDNLSTIIAQGNIGDNENIDTVDSKTYDVTNNGATAYIWNGEEFNNNSNPNLTLRRGETYTFNLDAPGHPFLIKTVQGTGTSNLYDEGVTNNGAVSGTITFTVPEDAPDTLYYNCEFHGVMTGTINITD
ncbi:hypothetical protein [Christiangramia sp. OXR-203]|jgi:hypothetical protein|uniref:cupredoxin domain-containing protein n=1 Tax=Christiangramia sp. OXR-203 TaxID=3100176 RepID=UPI002AC8BA43|nr:hypothetical protein [Christiangramia sp. OXR-203]WPY98517.1 hypothetical protein T8I65_15235 [Christiangramia sp. OXR-203]